MTIYSTTERSAPYNSQVTSDDSLSYTVCLFLSRRIRLYPLDFGVFYCFVHRVKLKIYIQNTPKWAISTWKCNKKIMGRDTAPPSMEREHPLPHLTPSAPLPLQMQFLDPSMYRTTCDLSTMGEEKVFHGSCAFRVEKGRAQNKSVRRLPVLILHISAKSHHYGVLCPKRVGR